MKRVITYGNYDALHIGHYNYLKKAKALGDYLVVAISSDEFSLGKGKKTLFTYEERRAMIESTGIADLIIKEETWEQKIDDVKKYDIDIFTIADDWAGKFDFLSDYCEVIYLPRTDGISTSEIKKRVIENYKNASS